MIDTDHILSPDQAAEVRRIETARTLGRQDHERDLEWDQDLDISM